MSSILELIREPWPWYVAGPILALVMFALIYFDKTFGFSANLSTLCSAAGAGKVADFFKVNWKDQKWNLVFLVGTVIGGFISYNFLIDTGEVEISNSVISSLQSELGFENAGAQYLPPEIYGEEAFNSIGGLLILLGGGFLVGFGARYAGGCTSGHAITGLSNLQWPSLIAVVGFFIGGFLMTWIGLPLIFS